MDSNTPILDHASQFLFDHNMRVNVESGRELREYIRYLDSSLKCGSKEIDIESVLRRLRSMHAKLVIEDMQASKLL